MTTDTMRRLRLLPVALCVLAAGGCASNVSDLEDFIRAEKAKKPGPIEQLPQMKPTPSFIYQAQELRSPFVPDTGSRLPPSDPGEGGTSGVRPPEGHSPEPLEMFPLDGLKMVGTITSKGQEYGLVRDADGTVHRVKVGNYLGQNYGKINNITETEIRVTEIIPDGLGGWMERQAALGIDE